MPAMRWCRKHAGIGAILLECTNMVPYARALRDRLGIPVYDIYSFMIWFHAGLAPRDFGHPGSSRGPVARAVRVAATSFGKCRLADFWMVTASAD